MLLIALITHASGLVLWSQQVAHLPIFTPAETLSSLGFIIALLTLGLYWRSQYRFQIQLWTLIIISLLLTTAVLWPAAPPCFDYNHSYIYALLFHLFRRLALALGLFASAIFISALTCRNSNSPTAINLRGQGRLVIITATLAYLLSEDIGIIWCQKGWADIWRWSPGFMISTMVLIYLMLALHLPGGSRKPGNWYSLIGLSCGPIMFIAQFFKP